MESLGDHDNPNLEQNKSGTAQELAELANEFDPQKAQERVEAAKGREQLLRTLANAAEVQHVLQGIPVLTFDGARQVLEQYYTGQASPFEDFIDVDYCIPRYLAENWIKNDELPAEGFTIEHDAKSNHGFGPVGEDMLKVNDILVNTPSGERVQFFGMNKDEGIEGIDWQYAQINVGDNSQTVKVETLPKFIDNFIFWAMYQRGEPKEHTSNEAKRVLKLANYLSEDERDRLDEGFFSKDYIAKLEYCIAKNDSDFEPTSSPEELKKAEEEIVSFQEKKDQIETERRNLLSDLKESFNTRELVGEVEEALRGYESKIARAFSDASSPEEFVKNIMDGMTDNDIYKIVFRKLNGPEHEKRS